MNLKKAKTCFIKNHPLGKLTISELKKKASELNIFVYGDKSQILQCFSQSEQMTKLFRINKP